MTLEDAINGTFLLFQGTYGARWTIPTTAVPGWVMLLGSIGATPEEVLAAAQAWSLSRPWPPSLAELRCAIPRFCRCGTCVHCNRRAQALATRLANHGAHGGAVYSAPTSVAVTTAKLLGAMARPALPPKVGS